MREPSEFKQMPTQKKQWKIYQEEAKTRQTSHWDWDYMSREELETAMKEQRPRDRNQEENSSSVESDKKAGRSTRVSLVWVIALLIAGGILLYFI